MQKPYNCILQKAYEFKWSGTITHTLITHFCIISLFIICFIVRSFRSDVLIIGLNVGVSFRLSNKLRRFGSQKTQGTQFSLSILLNIILYIYLDDEQMMTGDITNASLDELNSALQEKMSLCQNLNPYVMKNDGWIPKHIWIAPRTWYSYLAIYMTCLTILCCFLNGIVIVATIKYKVIYLA